MKIGITCYPTFGGSGIIATGIGVEMARRGHEVHFICSAVPARLEQHERVHVHLVGERNYPVFPTMPYSLALASKMVDVARTHALDVLHPHYAVPHATSAWMAREVLGGAVKVVTTLHGTDITLVGSDPTYLPITRHSIASSDWVTSPSQFLADETYARFDLDAESTPIAVIPNFVDTETFRPGGGERLAGMFGNVHPTVVHVSNFRRLKRVDIVVDVFARLGDEVNLLLIGDGPERAEVLEQVEAAGLQGRVRWLGAVDGFADVLREAAVFLLPSETESFGLAALEALSSGVPVVASAVGGLPEVVVHGETGYLESTVEGLTQRVSELVGDAALRARMGRAARADVLQRFRLPALVDTYESMYRSVTR